MLILRDFSSPGKVAALPAVADIDIDGLVVGLEIFLSGSGLSGSSMPLRWMDAEVLGHRYDDEEEILTIYTVDGRSSDQFSTQVLVLIDGCGEISGIAWPDNKLSTS